MLECPHGSRASGKSSGCGGKSELPILSEFCMFGDSGNYEFSRVACFSTHMYLSASSDLGSCEKERHTRIPRFAFFAETPISMTPCEGSHTLGRTRCRRLPKCKVKTNLALWHKTRRQRFTAVRISMVVGPLCIDSPPPCQPPDGWTRQTSTDDDICFDSTPREPKTNSTRRFKEHFKQRGNPKCGRTPAKIGRKPSALVERKQRLVEPAPDSA